MKAKNHLLSLLLFIIAVGLRLAIFLVGGGVLLTASCYFALFLGIIVIALDSFKQTEYAMAIAFDNRFRLNIFAYLAGAGFFIDFVGGCVGIYDSIDSKSYLILTSFLPLCLSCVCAIFSSFYFIAVASSVGGSNYDFRKLRVFHIMPLIWAVSKLFGVLDQAVSFVQPDMALTKYIALIFGTCAFFAIVGEIDSDSGANRSTVFFIRSFCFTGVFYFINQLVLLASGNSYFQRDDGLLGVTILFVCGFMYFCEKSIISRTRLEV